MWSAEYDTVNFVQAVDWFARRIPITAQEFARDVEKARRQSFWLAGVTQAEIVRQVHASLTTALERGDSFEDWKAAIGPTLQRAWGAPPFEGAAARMETVLRNASQGAYSRARWEQMEAPAVKRLRPYRMFDAVRDSRTSPICSECDGTVLPADDPFWETHLPPLHHRCRSGIRSLTEAKAEAIGIAKRAPKVEADEGFGTHDEWEGPDRSKYPRGVKPPRNP